MCVCVDAAVGVVSCVLVAGCVCMYASVYATTTTCSVLPHHPP